jgi:hypothetical protein
MGNLKTKSVVAACAVTLAALVVSPAAVAVATATTAYGGRDANIGSQAGSAQAAKPVHSDSPTEETGGLSFTALDLTLMLGGGIVLIASGVALGGLVLRRVRT